MKLRLNLLRGDGSHNLQITTDATATVGDVAAALASAGPSEAGQAIDPATVSINIIDTAGRGRARALTTDTMQVVNGRHTGATINPNKKPASNKTIRILSSGVWLYPARGGGGGGGGRGE